jgi:PKD repeat protein
LNLGEGELLKRIGLPIILVLASIGTLFLAFNIRTVGTTVRSDADIFCNGWSSSEYENEQEKYWVDHFDNNESTGWILVGDNPYLHNDVDSYITSYGTGNCSWFQFEDTSLATLQTVILLVEWRTSSIMSGGETRLYLDNGESEVDLGSFDLTLEYSWTEINVTGTLETISRVNDTRLKVESLHTGLYLVAVRGAYFKIYNGPVPVQTATEIYGKPSSQVTLSEKWIDQDGLSSYALNHNASGSWLAQNITGALTGTEAWSNTTIRLQNDTSSVLAYRFWANDTDGNWEKTDVLYVYPVKNFSPELLRYIEDVDGSPISHSYGRKDFFDNNTGRFWKFYSDGANIKYTSTEDGQTWRAPQSVRSVENGFEFYVCGGDGAVHYVYNSERQGGDVCYRKGLLNSNGTIAWVTSEQVAVEAGTSQRFYACSVVTDTNGYPYIVFGNRTDPNLKTFNLVRSTYNNGTWQTAGGFPKQINENPDSDLVSGVALSLPSDKIYVVYCSAGSEEPPRGRMWNEPFLSPLENASDCMMQSNYPFSAVTDSYGHIHIDYRRTKSRVDYSFRNYTTGNWEVKDELVTSYLTDEPLSSNIYSWPVISWNSESELVYVHWWTQKDKSAWLKIRNSTSWKSRQRIIRLNTDSKLVRDSSLIVPQSHKNETLINFILQNLTDGQKEVWAYIYTNRPPVASFTESAEVVYTNEAILFNAGKSHDSDGTILSYYWDFDDGINATGVVVEHTYYDDGNYTVTLTVTDDDGSASTATAIKTILNRSPVAVFTESAETVQTGEVIYVNASASHDSDGTITAYSWDFGDGTNTSGILVQHAYEDDGEYTVVLTVTDDDGAVDNITSTKTAQNRPPVASFSESAEMVYTDEPITFNASSSYDADGIIASYYWSFGDETNTTGVFVDHSYPEDRNYTVTLTVTDDDGATASVNASKIILNRLPVASFTESAETVCIGDVIYFNASQSYDPDGYIAGYFWDFGDGVNATEVTVEHSYAQNGTYTVTLTVTDDDDAICVAASVKTVLHHNIAVLAVTPPKTVVAIKSNVNINVTIENQGDFTETFNVTLCVNTSSIALESITLISGDSKTVSFTWNTTSFAKGNYTIKALADIAPNESNTTDNTLTDGWIVLTIPGDVDGDFDVDIYDIVKLCMAYGFQKGDPEYDANCDINCDGDINIYDIVIACSHYGEEDL